MSEETSLGIWRPYEAFYIDAMLFSTKSALASLRAANTSLNRCTEWREDPELEARDWESILDSVQNIVSCGAALSRYFWPVRTQPVHAARAARLRSSLGVKDDSPLKSRNLRNLIEHFDEKLDAYLIDGIVGHILPAIVANRPEETEVPHHLFRAYYTEVAIFEVLGERFEIKPLAEEIDRLHSLLTKCLKNGSVLPAPERDSRA